MHFAFWRKVRFIERLPLSYKQQIVSYLQVHKTKNITDDKQHLTTCLLEKENNDSSNFYSRIKFDRCVTNFNRVMR